jgi:hypothetical protein
MSQEWALKHPKMSKLKPSLIAFILLIGVIQFVATKASAGTCTTTTSYSGTRTIVTFTSSDSSSAQCASWSVPGGVSSVDVLAVAGGGGGGRGRGGGGGGGGVASLTNFSVTGGESFQINIGGGGAAATGESRGGTGGNSSVVRNSDGNTFAIAGGGGGGGSHHGSNPRTLEGNEGDGARGNGGFVIPYGEAASGSGGGSAMSYISQISDSNTTQTRWFYRGGDHGDFNTVAGGQRGGGNQGGGSYFCPYRNDPTYDNRRATGGGGGAGSDGKGTGTTQPDVNYDCNNWSTINNGPHGGAGASNSISGSNVIYGAGGGGADARGNGEATAFTTLGRGDGYDGGGSGQSYYNCCNTPVQSVTWDAVAGQDRRGAGGGGGVDTAARGGTGVVIISYVGLPTISSCSANNNGTTVTINFTESSLSTSNIPPRTAFAINNSGSPRLVRSVNTPTSNSVVLNVATIYQGESITVTYTSPGGSNSLQNVNGLQIASGSCPSVTNSSTVNLIAKYDSTSQSYPGTGTVWNDISGNPNHEPYNLDIKGPVDFTQGTGFKFNGPAYTPSPQTDVECGSTDGVNRTSCIRHAVKPDFQNLGTTWSIFAWVKLDTSSGNEAVVATLSRCPNKLNENDRTAASVACSNNELIFGVHQNQVYAWDFDGAYSPGFSSTGWRSVTTLSTNTWYYIGMVRNTVGSNTTYTMYINGEAARIRLNNVDTINTSTTIARSPNYGTDNLNLGGDWRDNARNFPGTIKAFYIYDDAVSAEVASNEYTSTLVTMSSVNDQLLERGTVTVSASASAGTISYTATGACTVNSNSPIVTFTGVGSCTVTATGSSGGLVDRTFNIVQNLDLNLPSKLPVYPTSVLMKIPTIPITTSNSQRVFTCLDLVGTASSTTALSNSELSIEVTTSGDDALVNNSQRSKTVNSTLAQARTLYERVRVTSSSGRLLGFNSGNLYLLWRANLIADSVNDVAGCNNFDSGARGWIKLEDIQASQRREVDVTITSGNDT